MKDVDIENGHLTAGTTLELQAKTHNIAASLRCRRMHIHNNTKNKLKELIIISIQLYT